MTNMAQCRHETCTAEFKDHRWGRIHAHDAGWFAQKDGVNWCPEHTPPWVESWRAKSGTATPKPSTKVMHALCLGCTEPILRPVGEGQVWTHEFSGEEKCES